MANPSLQIGNDNWAIKEDNLLGYSTAGTRFVPQPITMTRATLGTRVNPEGLVEDVALLGSELVTCGDFSCATPSTYWNPNIGWSIGDNKASNDGTDGILRQIGAVPLNTKFKVVFTVDDYVTGNIQIKFAPVPQTIVITGDGTYTIYTDGNNSVNGDLQIIAINSFQGSITNISVKEVTIENLARVDYTDGTSSLLVEPQRTNLIPYSEDFSDSSWIKSGVIITPNNATSPDGTTNASTVNFSASSQYLLRNQNITFAIGDSISTSIYADTNTSDFLSFGGATPSGTDVSNVETLSSGFYRHTLTRTFTASGTSVQFIIWDAAIGNYVIWGAQLEAGSYATSYIKTSGSTVTRNQETYTKTGISDLINSEEGCVFGEGNFAESDSGSGYFYFVSLSDGTPNNRLEIRQSNTNLQFLWRVATYQDNIITSGVDVSSNFKFALSYSSSNIKFYVNGNPIGTINTPTLWSADTLNRMAFDNGSGGDILSGKVKQLQVFKTALSDSELATLTT